MKRIGRVALVLAWACMPSPELYAAATSPTRITILVDAFGDASELHRDWGFSALVEHGGKRILFDTGNDADFFADNARLLGVDLTRLDFVVISHRHGDHTDGLRHLLKVNPNVKIYAPDDEYFGGNTPTQFFSRPVPSLPERMRYFGGQVPPVVPHGSPWKGANVERIGPSVEVAPGIRLVSNVAPSGPFSQTPEVSLVLETAHGQILVVGCSHPGIEQILTSADAKRKPVRLLAGGLHLVMTPDAEIDRLATALRDDWKLAAIAPGHCTGETAFAALRKIFGRKYLYAGVGRVVDITGS